jgi:hypothetical protein
MRGRGKVTRVNGGTETTHACYAAPDDRWTPDWDKGTSGEQPMERAKERRKMGQKLTPKGAGTLVKTKR